MSEIKELGASRRNLYEWLALILAIGLVGAVFIYVHDAEVTRLQASEQDRLRVMTAFVANDIGGGLTTVSQVMGAVIQDYLSAPGTEESSHFLTLRLRALQGALPGIRALAVIDKAGIVTHASSPELVRLNLSHRQYFQRARKAPEPATLYISSPFQSYRRESDLVISASRMVPGPRGEFGGVLVAIIAKEYFSEPFGIGRYAPDVWGIVVHGDGQQIMNFPEKNARIDGADLSRTDTFFRRHLDSGRPESILTGRVSATGESRLMHLRTVSPPALHMDKPIIIGLSREIEAMALPMHRQAVNFGLFFGALALLSATMLAWMQKHRDGVDASAAAHESERQQAEHEKRLLNVERESERRFRTLIEDAPLAIAILRRGHFIYTNPRYRILHGYTPDDSMTGRPWSAMITPASRRLLAEQEALILSDSPTEQRFEVECIGKGESPVPIFKTTTRVEFSDGPATLLFAQDISTQKSAEHALLQARDIAEAASRAKAEFLANMSHEIRSPLNAILGLTYLLDQSALQVGARDMVRKIQSSGRMLLGIVNDVLDVSKIEAGRMVLEQAPFSLADVIDNVAASMGITVGDKELQLIIHPPPAGVATLLGDALRLEQILTNLTGNAIKFTHTGRVALRVSLASQVGARVELRFSVTDTGIGIVAELQDEVFSAFSQADTSTTRRFGGTGLGLAICRRLVALMGGRMGLNSVPGAGSEFWFTLPLPLLDDTLVSSPDMAHIDALVADDSEIALKVIGDIASGLGWQVSAVTSGEAVLSRLRSAQHNGTLPNVVILDWKMPGMDGLATARAIRETLSDAECPIVIMATASCLATMARQPGAELVDAVLNKPVTASALYNATAEARSRRAAGADSVRHGAGQALLGIRVLVVDDSEINRDVAQRILLAQGAQVTLAADGSEALNWLMAHPDAVDVVLMDVQMPVMDGIEATRQLRRMARFDDLPIVALTAGAFKSQQELANAAGMTHFVSKPFDVPATIALIGRIGRRVADPAPDAADAQASQQAPHAPPTASSAIDVQRGLQIWSDIDTYHRYLCRFVGGYGDVVDVINADLGAHDRPAAAALAHKLAGVAGNLCLPDTQRLALEAERVLAMNQDPAAVLVRLRAALDTVVVAIGSLAPAPMVQDREAPRSTQTPATLRPLFTALLAAIDTDHPGPVETVLAELSAHLPPIRLRDLSERIAAFDFGGAKAAAVALAAQLEINP